VLAKPPSSPRSTVAIATIEPGPASPGVSIARSFRSAEGSGIDRVVGMASEKDVARLRGADLGLWTVVSSPSPQDGDAFLDRLKEIRARSPVDVLVPATTRDVAALVAIEHELAEAGVRTFLPSSGQLELLRSTAPHAPARDGVPTNAYAVAAVGDGRGGVAGMAALRKIDAEGDAQRWVGVAAQDAALRDRIRAFAAQTRLRGPVEIDLVGEPRGEFRLVRVEPRFPAWVHLFAGPGPNLPVLLVRLARGEDVEPQAELPGGPLLVGAAWEAWMTHD